jgi:hypothetical protein
MKGVPRLNLAIRQGKRRSMRDETLGEFRYSLPEPLAM